MTRLPGDRAAALPPERDKEAARARGQTQRFRCTYSRPCGEYDRHCSEIVALDAPDPTGLCNHSCYCPGCDPDLTHEAPAVSAR